jgi:hypothetical protein
MITPSPVQTAYQQYEGPGQVGMVATGLDSDIITRIAEDPAGTGIGFGLVVCQGTVSDMAATLGELSGGAVIGVTVADPTLPNLVDVNGQYTDKYSDKDNMAVMIKGDIWVKPATNVSAGGAVYFNSSTGELGDSGISNAVEITNARWVTTYPGTDTLVTTGDLAIVRLKPLA